MLPIVVLVGNAGSGKDTVGKIITEKMGGTTVAFADKLKSIACDIFQFSYEQLWGESDRRNTADYRFQKNADAWDYADSVLDSGHHIPSFIDPFSPNLKIKGLDVLKNVIRKISVEYTDNLSPRVALQLLGTEWGRSVEKDVWANYTKEVCMELLGGGCKYDRHTASVVPSNGYNCPFIVITDCRFLNEIALFKSIGAQIWKIEAPETAQVGVQAHASESELKTVPDHFFDVILYNDKSRGLKHLSEVISTILASGYGSTDRYI